MSQSALHSVAYGIHWFRRDLRVIANPALTQNLQAHQGRVLGVFFFDARFLSRSDFSHNRFGFFLKTLQALKEEMSASGGELLVLEASPDQGFLKIFENLRSNSRALPQLITWNRDYEPFARERDQRVTKLVSSDWGIPVKTSSDHLLLEPQDIYRPDGGSYQVFTPFSKRWLAGLTQPDAQARLGDARAGLQELERLDQGLSLTPRFRIQWKDILSDSKNLLGNDVLQDYLSTQMKKVTVPLPEAGSLEAYRQLKRFSLRINHYPEGRNYPSQDHTSKLSIYLKNGSLTSAQIFAFLSPSDLATTAYLRQLIWREFYYHILYHHPRVENEAFLKKYGSLKWQNREDWFEAWKLGKTGVPIVDAGMRQLLSTGLMHNRVRMIVASYLTKDLIIDWKWGEKWFMQNLLDGDLAPNNGGWQWAASTGCDPQPYFRIFNPKLQSQRFDPQGQYIRTYVPELSHVSDQEIHEPSTNLFQQSYPRPLVDHDTQKKTALKLFQQETRV